MSYWNVCDITLQETISFILTLYIVLLTIFVLLVVDLISYM